MLLVIKTWIVYLSFGKCSATTSGLVTCINVLKNPIAPDTIANPMKSYTYKNATVKSCYKTVHS